MRGTEPAPPDVYLLPVGPDLGDGELEVGLRRGRAEPQVGRPRAEELRVASERRSRVGDGCARRLPGLPQEVVLAGNHAVLVPQGRPGVRVAVRLRFALRPRQGELAVGAEVER